MIGPVMGNANRRGEEAPAAEGRRLSRGKRALFAGAALVLVLAVVEIGFRVVFALAGGDATALKNARTLYRADDFGAYEPWPYVGYRLSPAKAPSVRPYGFQSTNPVEKAKRPGVPRVAFTGGSTTWSGNALFYRGSFPYFCEVLLEKNGVVAEAMNCGNPGWTSVESLINYELNIVDFSPDWLVIHHGVNDAPARYFPDFRSDYGHFTRPGVYEKAGILGRILSASDLYTWLLVITGRVPRSVQEWLYRPLPPENERLLVPDGLVAFRRNTEHLIDVAQAHGASVLITTESHNRRPGGGKPEANDVLRRAIDESNETMRALARDRGLPLADTEVALDGKGRVFLDYVHVSPEGNQLKADCIVQALFDAGIGKYRRQ